MNADPLVEYDRQTLLPKWVRHPRTPEERLIVGRICTRLKARVGHGDFEKELSKVAPFGARRAREYMAKTAEHDRPANERWEREQRANHEALWRDIE